MQPSNRLPRAALFSMRTLLAALSLLLTLSFLIGASLTSHATETVFMAYRAIRISDTEVLVEFTLPLNDAGVGHPYIALRRCYTTPHGECDGLAWEGDQALQHGKESWHFYGNDRQRVVIVFPKSALDEYLSTENPYYKEGLRTFLCMEELLPPDGDDEYTLFDVVAQNGTELYSSYPGASGNWNGTYLPIEVDYNYTPGIIPTVTLPPPPPDPDAITDIVTFPLITDADTSSPSDEEANGCSATLSLPVLVLPTVTALGVALKKKRK